MIVIIKPDSLNRNNSQRIQRAIESRLTTEPERYGEPLQRTLKGYWKLRVVDYRVVFKVLKTEVMFIRESKRDFD